MLNELAAGRFKITLQAADRKVGGSLAIGYDDLAILAVVQRHAFGFALGAAVADAVVDAIADIGAALFEPYGRLAGVIARRTALSDSIPLRFRASGTPAEAVAGFAGRNTLLIVDGDCAKGQCG
jgi:hypothetical protein